MATFLPEDLVLFEILTRLPVKHLIRFKCVSKNWMTCISGNRSFIDAHRRLQQPSVIILYKGFIDSYVLPPEDFEPATRDLDPEDFELAPDDLELQSPEQKLVMCSEQFSKSKEVDLSYLIEEYGPIELKGSCEGLVCLTIDDYRIQGSRVVLWNPATQQRRLLPSPADGSRVWGVGIGLDEASGDWKVVRLCLDSDDLSTEAPKDALLVRAHVLTKSSSTVWRDGGVSGIKGHFQDRSMDPVAATEALHWSFFPGCRYDRKEMTILSFSLTDEVFRFANGPDPEWFVLCSLRSSLAAFTIDSWSTILNVASPSSCGGVLSWNKLVKFSSDLCFIWREHYLACNNFPPFTLVLVDPEDPGELTSLEQHICAEDSSFVGYDYVESIISVF